MELYKKLSFDTSIIEQVRQATLAEMSTMNLNEAQIHFLRKPIVIMNEYLQKHYPGIPNLFNCILFHRPGNYPQTLHLDCNNDNPPQIMHCAINIPILNCEDSYMEWYSGNYSTSVNVSTGIDGIVRKFINLNWNEDPSLIDKVIIDKPTLVRVGIPHKVTVIDKTRSLITLRFQNNPTFDNIRDLII
jgi:hypothetical protein